MKTHNGLPGYCAEIYKYIFPSIIYNRMKPPWVYKETEKILFCRKSIGYSFIVMYLFKYLMFNVAKKIILAMATLNDKTFRTSK